MVVRIGQCRENFGVTGTILCSSEDNRLWKILVVPLRIDHTQLITSFAKALE